MKKIKNIIFDLGGIFIDIHFKRTENAFISLGINNWNEFYTQSTASALFEDLETGKITPQEFYDKFREETGRQLTNEQIRDAWNAMLGDFHVERLQWLEEICTRYKVYLYSNTNAIHYDAFQAIYRRCTGKQSFDDYFIKAYYSHELGERKPYPESFVKLLEIESLVAGETLFVDDTAKNIEGAKLAGLQTRLVTPPDTVFDIEL